jgi:hypothetical protein
MKQEPSLNQEAGKRTKTAGPRFNIVIVYDAKNAASRAMNFVSGLVRQFGDDFGFRCGLWRFDVLGLPRMRTAAARAGDAADLLIVSALSDTDLPLPVKDWLNWCADGKTPGSAALVALLESHRGSDEAQCSTRQFLQSAADRSLMDLFLYEVNLPQTSPASASETVRERANPCSAAFQKIFLRGRPPPRSRA